MPGKLRRALDFLREQGPRRFYFKTLMEYNVYLRFWFLAADLTVDGHRTEARVPVTFAPVQGEDLEDHVRSRPDNIHAFLKGQMAEGAACHGAFHGLELAGVCWTRVGRMVMPHLGIDARLAPDEAYFFDAFTHPRYRGLGIQPALCGQVMATLAAQGIRLGMRLTLPDNRSALKAHAKSGFRPYALIQRFGPGRLHWSRFRWLPAPAGRSIRRLPSYPPAA